MTQSRMPSLFIGHGNPMNVLEENTFTQSWRQLGDTLPGLRRYWPFRLTGIRAAQR